MFLYLQCQFANQIALQIALQPVWSLFETKMKAAGLSGAAIDAFKHNFEQLVAGVTGLVSTV